MLKRLPKMNALSAKSNLPSFHRERRGRRAAILAASLLALLGAGTALAQYRGTIQGTVTDQSGAAIPDAQLSLTDLNTNLTTQAKADRHGTYHFNQLPADRFKLVVSATGFAAKTLDTVTIIPEQPNTVNSL